MAKKRKIGEMPKCNMCDKELVDPPFISGSEAYCSLDCIRIHGQWQECQDAIARGRENAKVEISEKLNKIKQIPNN